LTEVVEATVAEGHRGSGAAFQRVEGDGNDGAKEEIQERRKIDTITGGVGNEKVLFREMYDDRAGRAVVQYGGGGIGCNGVKFVLRN
jgi:hypothetical protein